jgi:flavin reductase (DIM6/NTAB) family NADH-FMN oxidoreductase RutF
MIDPTLTPYRYIWPTSGFQNLSRWKRVGGDVETFVMDMPEAPEDLAVDSRWPAFFPSPICLVTATDGTQSALEKVVGASIVNRFPYVVALSFCRQPLSQRHHVRENFTNILERGGSVAVQYLPPGPALDNAMEAIHVVPENQSHTRLKSSGLQVREALTNQSPVFSDAYLVYEATLVRPTKDFDGQPIYASPWIDLGSHRVYFLEINAIQLRRDIAKGEAQILWRSLPAWSPDVRLNSAPRAPERPRPAGVYSKSYTPRYEFPSAGTIAFEADSVEDEMAVKHLPPLPQDQVEVDNDRARWPCFFPSSAGMITSWCDDGTPNVMPCGSTTVLSRHPLVIAPCVSYARINQRYAPRASLDIIRKCGRFGCGVPFIDDSVVDAMRYAGTVSIALDRDKLSNSGLKVRTDHSWSPQLTALPIHYDCEVIGEVRLGTHIMFLGEVRQIAVRGDVRPENPVEWYPWAAVRAVQREAVA